MTDSGLRYREGQPVVQTADGSIAGLDRALLGPSDYVPGNHGRRMNQPLKFIGHASTNGGDVQEIAVMNGNAGIWYIISPKDCAVIGQIFTGADGGWSTGMPNAWY